jgi:secretion/DNA translocation related TadE-like protein
VIRLPRGPDRDAGSATVLVLGLTAVVWVAGLAVLLLAQVANARARAATAADLAALAGASHVVTGDSCRAAARVAAAQSAELASCRVDGWRVQVTAHVPLGGALSLFPPAKARARAGPSALPTG